MRDFPRISQSLVLVLVLTISSNLLAQSAKTQPTNSRIFTGLIGSTNQRVQKARQRVAQASYTASNIQANAIRPVDYSVLEETVEPSAPEAIKSDIAVSEDVFHENGYSGDCTSCSDSSCSSCNTFCIPLCLRLRTEDLQVRTGVHGFKNHLNRGMDGSFGFLYGFNWGAPLNICGDNGLSVQFGINGSNANLYGASFTDDKRDQFFLTGGIFRRVDWGWQGGIVIDYLKENWYYDTDMAQLRGEFSWVGQNCNEYGFWFATSDRTQNASGTVTLPGASAPTVLNETLETEQLYAFFWRRDLDNCGSEMRLSAGWTGQKKGLLAADYHVPISNCLALDTEFTFLIPDADDASSRNENEGWNIGLSLVWFPRCGATVGSKSYNRPLFDVANNGNFFLRRQ